MLYKRHIYLIFFLLINAYTCFSQSFDIDQIEQVYRPRLKLDSRYIFNSDFTDTTGTFSDLYSNAVFTFPVKSKLDAGFQLDLKDLGLKNLLTNSARLNVSQTMGSVRVGYRQMNLGFDSVLPKKEFYNISANVMGLKLDRKLRVIFYNLGLGFFEQNTTTKNPYPRVNSLIGRLHVKGLVRKYYYGLAVVYSEGLFLPMPFFGGSIPMGNKLILNYTLPAAVNFQYKSGKTSLFAGVVADGFRAGMKMKDVRTNLNHTGGQAYLMLRQRINNSVLIRLEGGYYVFSKLNISNSFFDAREYPVKPGPYLNVGITVLFGQTLFEKIADSALNKAINLF